MGCCQCACLEKRPVGESTAAPARTQYSWEQKAPVDRSLLIISNQQGGVVGRRPGQLNGKQFRIKDCQSATILVLDHTNTVSVEKCVDCQILIGPTKGSLYLRECVNCQFVVACQQFRARDCKKCSISLFTSTQPVIESSTKLKFSCFQCSYPELKHQFDSIDLNVFDNCWSNIHDFDRGLDETNWSLLPPDSPPLITLPIEGEFSTLGLSLEPEKSIVPLTVGSNSRPEGEACLVIFFNQGGFEDRALEFSRQLHKKAAIVFTKKIALKELEAIKLFPDEATLRSSVSECSAIFLEVGGNDCVNLCHDLLEDEVSSSMVYVSPSPEQGSTDTHTFNTIIEVSLTMQ